MTAQGSPRVVFRRALERGNFIVAFATAYEVGHVSLDEALELLHLIALHDERRFPRAARRLSGAPGWAQKITDAGGECVELQPDDNGVDVLVSFVLTTDRSGGEVGWATTIVWNAVGDDLDFSISLGVAPWATL